MTDAVRMLAELVAIPSVTGTPGEKRAVEWLESTLSRYGIPSQRVGDPQRPNLVAHLSSGQPAGKPLVLLSHIDVAPANEAQWTHPPFGAITDGGRLYGRGTLDTKQLTVMELAAFLRLHRSGLFRRDVYLVATIDEEKGSEMGAALLAREMPALFQNVIAVSEGGGFPLMVGGQAFLTMTVGEKGCCRVRLTAKGQGGHAGAPGDDQAVVKLTRALGSVLGGVEQLEKSGAVREAMVWRIGDRPEHPFAAELLDYASRCGVHAPPFQIGEKVNVLPAAASVTMELRPLPGATRAQVEGWLAGWLANEEVSFEILSFQPGILCPPQREPARSMIAKVEQAAAEHGFPAKVLAMLALGRTDGRFFTGHSSVFGFSPLGPLDAFDDILPMVHGNDESVSLSGFEFGCDVFCDLVEQLAMEVDA